MDDSVSIEPDTEAQETNTETLYLTEEQELIAAKAVNFVTTADLMQYQDGPRYVIGGYAGTGKTFLIEHIINELKKAGKNGRVVSFTGRACFNLIQKGIQASTGHSLLKRPKIDEKTGEVLYWETKEIHQIQNDVGDFLIIEECSMMPEDLLNDLFKAINVPIIFVGDDAQIPPVKARSIFDLMLENDYAWDVDFLSVIKRQGEGSAIIKMATAMRTTGSFGSISVTDKNEVNLVKKDRKTVVSSYIPQVYNDFDVIATVTNKMRRAINAKVRACEGHHSPTPEPGEIIVCLQNDYVSQRFISNGERFRVLSVMGSEHKNSHMYQIESIDMPDGFRLTVSVDDNMFVDEEVSNYNMRNKKLRKFTYGYCMTTHKLQGAGFPRVLYIDQDLSFLDMDMQAIRYTAITRAQQKLTVVCV